MNKQDFCCGLTMVGVMNSMYSEGGVLIHDVPMLVCPTCHNSHIAPDCELDFIMLSHNCETDRVKVSSLQEAVGEEKVNRVLGQYPEDERIRTGARVLPEQIDSTLDMINIAKLTGDEAWHEELLGQLKKLTSYSRVNAR